MSQVTHIPENDRGQPRVLPQPRGSPRRAGRDPRHEGEGRGPLVCDPDERDREHRAAWGRVLAAGTAEILAIRKADHVTVYVAPRVVLCSVKLAKIAGRSKTDAP